LSLNKYQITHYWSDENTFPETIETYTLKAKNEDNIIKRIKRQESKEIRKEINDIGTYPTTIGLDLVSIDSINDEITLTEFNKLKPDYDLSDNLQEDYPYIRFYGWSIVNLSEDSE
jgi:hypothetical protein